MSRLRIEGKYAIETSRWLSSVAALVIQRHVRAVRGRQSSAELDSQPTHRSPRDSMWHAAAPHLERLPRHQRQAVELRLRDGMRYSQIAVLLDLPVGTVRSRLARGRARLKALIAGTSQTSALLAASGGLRDEAEARWEGLSTES